MNSKNLLGKFCYPILQYQHNFKKSTHFFNRLEGSENNCNEEENKKEVANIKSSHLSKYYPDSNILYIFY